MQNIIFRRILIIGATLLILLGLELGTDSSLLLNLPSELDVISYLSQESDREQLFLEAQRDYLLDQQDILQDFTKKLNEQREVILLDQQKIEEERLKIIEEAIKNAYTLGDRNKPQDYQNLFNDGIKHTFIVDFDSTEWQDLKDSMNDYNNQYGSYRSNEYHQVDVTYLGDEEEIYIQDVGIRTKGNIYSRYIPEDGSGNVIPVHYVLKFNETFDAVEGTQEYDWLKKREVFDLEQLIFKWNRVNDSTYINELYSYRMFKEAGVTIPEMSLSKFVIRIDGVVKMEELYTIQEQMDEEFIRKHLQETPTSVVGDMYKVVWPGTLEPLYDNSDIGIREWETNYRPTYGLKTNTNIPNNFSNLRGFTTRLDSYSGIMLKNYLEDKFDVDMFIRTLAVNVLVGNPDDYRGNANNYYLYFDENNFLTFLPFDYDNSMGEGWSGSPIFIDYTIGNDIYTWEGNGFGSNTDDIPLVEKILEYEEYQILYEGYLETFIADGYFSETYYINLFDTFERVYGDEFDMSYNKHDYISGKIDAVLEDIDYYRNERD